MTQQHNAQIQIGMNARLFPNLWRPAIQEVAFAAQAGFSHLQFPGTETGLDAERLGAPAAEVGEALRAAGVGAVMEIVVRLTPEARTAAGGTAVTVLEANLPAIEALGIKRVHWHFVRHGTYSPEEVALVETLLHADLARGVALAQQYGFWLGFEHNAPGPGLFSSLPPCLAALEAIPDLGFVWDVNHNPPDEHAAYTALAPRLSLLHVSDTPLPELNHHQPIGQGSIDFGLVFGDLLKNGYHGPAILEIGGQPFAGGFGRDTDEALIDSQVRLRAALDA